MAHRVQNDKGFLVIAMTVYEAFVACGFGYYSGKVDVHELICDNCNKLLNNSQDEQEVYYVPVLNRVLCHKCYNSWYAHAVRYDEDIAYEEKYFNLYAKRLNLIV